MLREGNQRNCSAIFSSTPVRELAGRRPFRPLCTILNCSPKTYREAIMFRRNILYGLSCRQSAAFILFFAACFLQTGCGNVSGSSTSTPPAQVPTSISLAPPSAVNYLGLPLPAITVSILDQSGNLDTTGHGQCDPRCQPKPRIPSPQRSPDRFNKPRKTAPPPSLISLWTIPARVTLSPPPITNLPSVTSAPFTVLASHSNLLSISDEATTPSNWGSHASASFPVAASTTGDLVLSSLESQLNNQTLIP